MNSVDNSKKVENVLEQPHSSNSVTLPTLYILRPKSVKAHTQT